MNATVKRSALLFSIVLMSAFASAQTMEPYEVTEKEGARKLSNLLIRLNSLEDWRNHADSIKKQIRKGMDLEVFPVRTPLNSRYRNEKTLDGYTVESVVFESLPGFFVTGNLYRPDGKLKKNSMAAILCPQGHFGEDTPKDYGRYRKDMQLRCAALAKMGAVVFAYDMVGWGESIQLPHTFPKVLALQTWNSIRAIDFLLSLPEADPNRVGVTGASGAEHKPFL